MRLLAEIDADTFGRKGVELRDRIATLSAQLKASDGDRSRMAETAAKVFELSQGLEQQWVGAKYAEKRRILDTVCLNFALDGATLVPTMRKPFDMVDEGLSVSLSRGDKI